MAWPNKEEAPEEYFTPLIHPITKKQCPVPERGWRYPEKTMKDLYAKSLLLFGENEDKQPERKYYLDENLIENTSSIIEFGSSDESLFKDLKLAFPYPKPVDFIRELISSISNDADIILDSFGGSGTTAHAVLALNDEDKKSRKFILVQIDENVKEKSKAHKLGFRKVQEILVKRLQLVSSGYPDSKGRKVDGLGGGFKYYKLSTPLFTKNKENIVGTTTWEQLAPYLYFTEFKKAIEDKKSMKKPFVGVDQKVGLYLIYKEPQINHIDKKFVEKIKGDKSKKKIVYADYVDVDDEVLKGAGIIFRQIPYDIFCI